MAAPIGIPSATLCIAVPTATPIPVLIAIPTAIPNAGDSSSFDMREMVLLRVAIARKK